VGVGEPNTHDGPILTLTTDNRLRDTEGGDMRRYLVEVGMGTDLHHPDPTKCAVRAVRDAIYHCSMLGLKECNLLQSIKDMYVKIKICVPFPEKVDRDAVLKEIPYGQRELEVADGGLLEEGSLLRDGKRDNIMVAVAAVTVMVP